MLSLPLFAGRFWPRCSLFAACFARPLRRSTAMPPRRLAGSAARERRRPPVPAASTLRSRRRLPSTSPLTRASCFAAALLAYSWLLALRARATARASWPAGRYFDAAARLRARLRLAKRFKAPLFRFLRQSFSSGRLRLASVGLDPRRDFVFVVRPFQAACLTRVPRCATEFLNSVRSDPHRGGREALEANNLFAVLPQNSTAFCRRAFLGRVFAQKLCFFSPRRSKLALRSEFRSQCRWLCRDLPHAPPC